MLGIPGGTFFLLRKLEAKLMAPTRGLCLAVYVKVVKRAAQVDLPGDVAAEENG